MTAVKSATEYYSGWCGSGGHDRCRGAYAGCVCCCDCHRPPEPEPEAEALTLPAHFAGVASVGHGGKLAQAVCTCGWTASERRPRNHDAFDDAREHLATAVGRDAP